MTLAEWLKLYAPHFLLPTEREGPQLLAPGRLPPQPQFLQPVAPMRRGPSPVGYGTFQQIGEDVPGVAGMYPHQGAGLQRRDTNPGISDLFSGNTQPIAPQVAPAVGMAAIAQQGNKPRSGPTFKLPGPDLPGEPPMHAPIGSSDEIEQAYRKLWDNWKRRDADQKLAAMPSLTWQEGLASFQHDLSETDFDKLTKILSRLGAGAIQGEQSGRGIISGMLSSAWNPEADTLGTLIGRQKFWGSKAAGFLADLALDPTMLLTMGAPITKARGLFGSGLLGSNIGRSSAILDRTLTKSLAKGLESAGAEEAAVYAPELAKIVKAGGAEGLSITNMRFGAGLDALGEELFQKARPNISARVTDDALQKGIDAGLGNVQRSLRPAEVAVAGYNLRRLLGHSNKPYTPYRDLVENKVGHQADKVRIAAQPAVDAITEPGQIASTPAYWQGEAQKVNVSNTDRISKLQQQIAGTEDPKALARLEAELSGQQLMERATIAPEDLLRNPVRRQTVERVETLALPNRKASGLRAVAQEFHSLSGVDPVVRTRIERGGQIAEAESQKFNRQMDDVLKGVRPDEVNIVFENVRHVPSVHDEAWVVPEEFRKAGIYALPDNPLDAAGIAQQMVIAGVPASRASVLAEKTVALRGVLDSAYDIKNAVREQLTGKGFTSPLGYTHSDTPYKIWEANQRGAVAQGMSDGGVLKHLEWSPRAADATRAKLEKLIEQGKAAGDDELVKKMEGWLKKIPEYSFEGAPSLEATRRGVKQATNLQVLADTMSAHGISPRSGQAWEDANLAGWMPMHQFDGTNMDGWLLPPAVAKLGGSYTASEAQAWLMRQLQAPLSAAAAFGVTGLYHLQRVAKMLPWRNWLLGGQGPISMIRESPTAANAVVNRIATTAESGLTRKVAGGIRDFFGVSDTAEAVFPYLHQGEATSPLLDVVAQDPSGWEKFWRWTIKNPVTKGVRSTSAAMEDFGAANFFSAFKRLGYSDSTAWEEMAKVYPQYNTMTKGSGYQLARLLMTYPQFYGEMGSRLLRTIKENPGLMMAPEHLRDVLQSSIPADERLDLSHRSPFDTLASHQIPMEEANTDSLVSAAISTLSPKAFAEYRSGKEHRINLNAHDKAELKKWYVDPSYMPQTSGSGNRIPDEMLAVFLSTGDPRYFPRKHYAIVTKTDNKFLVIGDRLSKMWDWRFPIAMATSPVRVGAMAVGSQGDYGSDIRPVQVEDAAAPEMVDDGQGNQVQARTQKDVPRFEKRTGIYANEFEKALINAYQGDTKFNDDGSPNLPKWAFRGISRKDQTAGIDTLLMVDPSIRKSEAALMMLFVPQSVSGFAQANPAQRAAALQRFYGEDTIHLEKLHK